MDEALTQTPGADVTPEEGGDAQLQEGASTDEAKLLAEVNKKTGKQFKSMDEYWKADKEKEAFIGGLGDIKEKAQKFDESEAKKSERERVSTREQEYYGKGGRVERMEFLYGHPEAKSVIEEIAALAKQRNMSMEQAYESSPLKKYVDKEKKDQEVAQPEFVASGQRLAPGRTGMSREEFAKLPREEQQKIVSKLPGWSQTTIGEVTKGGLKSSKRSTREF